MRRMRLARYERLSEILLWPFREQRFLNLRTYVTVNGEPGITFLTEWISSWTQAQLGPRLYGLPYRWGRHEFAHDPAAGRWEGRVTERGEPGAFSYRLTTSTTDFGRVAADSFAEFALERHTCFLTRAGLGRIFRIWHPPWPQAEGRAEVLDDSLLRRAAPWWPRARLIGAHGSAGAYDVWMGRPQPLRNGLPKVAASAAERSLSP